MCRSVIFDGDDVHNLCSGGPKGGGVSISPGRSDCGCRYVRRGIGIGTGRGCGVHGDGRIGGMVTTAFGAFLPVSFPTPIHPTSLLSPTLFRLFAGEVGFVVLKREAANSKNPLQIPVQLYLPPLAPIVPNPPFGPIWPVLRKQGCVDRSCRSYP
jgi:hypothetical protein